MCIILELPNKIKKKRLSLLIYTLYQNSLYSALENVNFKWNNLNNKILDYDKLLLIIIKNLLKIKE